MLSCGGQHEKMKMDLCVQLITQYYMDIVRCTVSMSQLEAYVVINMSNFVCPRRLILLLQFYSSVVFCCYVVIDSVFLLFYKFKGSLGSIANLF